MNATNATNALLGMTPGQRVAVQELARAGKVGMRVSSVCPGGMLELVTRGLARELVGPIDGVAERRVVITNEGRVVATACLRRAQAGDESPEALATLVRIGVLRARAA